METSMHDIQKTSPNNVGIFVSIHEATLWNIVSTSLLRIIVSLRDNFETRREVLRCLENLLDQTDISMNSVFLVLIGQQHISVENAHCFNQRKETA